ncbi:MAG: hypothetical protein ACLSHM_06480 [Vescimonas sp.]
MRKIYLVKKNPELPADGNNWLVMNSFEFRNFIQTPEGQKRRDRFGQLDACSVDDVIIIAECGTETAKQWRSEKDRHDYLVSIENQSGMTVFSYNTQTTTEDDMSGEELLVDQDCSVIDAILKKEEKSTLYAAVAKLSPAEINLMTSLYLCDDPIGQREYARRHGVAVTTINHQLTVALKKLKKNAPKLKFASYKSKKNFPVG